MKKRSGNSLLLIVVILLLSLFSGGDYKTDSVYNLSSFDERASEICSLNLHNQYGMFKRSYASAYFSNLTNNFPLNSHGTCSFTAIAMLLSYYDSFWSDTFVDEKYEVLSRFNVDESYGDKYGPDLNTESPGVLPEPSLEVAGLSNEDYLDYCQNHAADYYQSYLISTALRTFGWPISGLQGNPFGLSCDKMVSLINSIYCGDGLPLTNKVRLVTKTANSSNFDMECFLQDSLDEGDPVLLNLVFNQGTTREYKHSVVAYDYWMSDVRKEVFVHPGWQNLGSDGTLTHVSLRQLNRDRESSYVDFTGGCIIESAIKLERLTNCDPSYNYIDEFDNPFSSSSMFYPHNLKRTTPDYLDYQPVFEWSSLEAEEWRNIRDIWYEITLFDGNGDIVESQVYENGDKGFYSVSREAWERLTSTYTSQYSLLIYPRSRSYGLNDESMIYRVFEMPKNYSSSKQFSSVDFKTTFSWPRTSGRFRIGGLSFSSSWNGCSKNTDGFVAIKPKNNYQNAFLEFVFDKPILRMDIDSILPLFADRTVKIYAAETTAEPSVDETGSLSTWNASQMLWRSFVFSKPSKVITISVSPKIGYGGIGNQFTSFGEIIIKRFAFWETLPTSGFEIPYEPDSWNREEVVTTANCYAYALNCQVSLNGLSWRDCGLGGAVRKGGSMYVSAQNLIEGVKNDFGFFFGVDPNGPEINKYVKEVGRFDPCPEGMYKVVCFYVDGDGYHWYRQNPDGYWSQKDGDEFVSDLDFSGDRILDPLLCDRGGAYRDLLAYFAIKPFGVLYEC